MSHPQATLMIEQTGQSFSLEQPEVSIGRKSGNTIVLPDDNAVSRRHAIIFREGEHYIIQDAGSANGTFVNNERLTGLQPLHDGDILRIGRTLLTVHLPDAIATTEAQKPAPDLGVEDAEMTVAGAMPPVDVKKEDTKKEKPPPPPERLPRRRIETTVTLPKLSTGQLKGPPTNRNLLLIQDAEEAAGNFTILAPESGEPLLHCVQTQGLVKSVLKAAGGKSGFDYWLQSPANEPLLRITKGAAMRGRKPVEFKDGQGQMMGQLTPKGGESTSFEVFDAANELLFSIEQKNKKFVFITGGMECASAQKQPTSAFEQVSSHQPTIVALEISNAVPLNSFIRPVILAALLAILVMADAPAWA